MDGKRRDILTSSGLCGYTRVSFLRPGRVRGRGSGGGGGGVRRRRRRGLWSVGAFKDDAYTYLIVDDAQ
ncbi:hypothetical protein K504DRAFT_468707 [Pleomassaria siparia CBS 279.74]|uniref:Uncharacterized protein n=1 Tax=Pleomassaria siparia CBS 279.74 TaxID=1314801 RepID=A0A6G1K7C4_9PLEO|nr:hypothetical protein K504DRAFT_468707 [Pleomassaria siparia CBS 279.74]